MNDLKQTLTEIGDGTPAYDVIDSAIGQAVRQRRTRQWTGAGAALVAVVTVAAGGYALADRDPPASPFAAAATGPSATPATTTQPGPLHCAVSALPVPAGYPAKSLVTGGDPSGRYQLGRVYPPSGMTAVIWDRRTPKAVDLPGADDVLSDVNSAGVAVGTSFQGDAAVAWVYRDGTATRLAGTNAYAEGVNERGEIVGTVGDRPVIWRSATAQPQFLALPKGITQGQVRGIDEDGTVIGNLGKGDLPRAYIWAPDGRLTALKLPATTEKGSPSSSHAFTIRNGQVGGEVRVMVNGGTGLYMFAAVWDLHTGDVKLTPQIARPAQINAQGWLVGRGHGQLVLLTGTAVVGLPLPDGTEFGRFDDVDTVSDDGTVVAGERNSVTNVDDIQALLWTCS